MINSFLSNFQLSLSDCLIIGFIVFIFFIPFWRNERNKNIPLVSVNNIKHSAFVSYIPTLLTTIGIFGTFLGIFTGLLNFNQADIEGSIPQLLSSLKTAFLTSLVGMFFSMLFKWIITKQSQTCDDDNANVSQATPELILEAINNQIREIKKLNSVIIGNNEGNLYEKIEELNKTVNKQTDNFENNLSLTKQFLAEKFQSVNKTIDKQTDGITKQNENLNISLSAKLDDINGTINGHAQEFKKQFDLAEQFLTTQHKIFSEKLWKKMDQFSELLSESATKQIITALNDVIKDFNEKISEQFGENFKELNSAVKDLVNWQNNYKEQLTQMSQQYSEGVKAITDTEKSVAQISMDSKSIPESMKALQQVIKVNQHQLDELRTHLEAFKDMKDEAVKAVPEIRSQIKKTVEDITNAATDASSELVNSASEINNTVTSVTMDFKTQYSKTNEQLEHWLTESSTQLKNMAKNVSDETKLIQNTMSNANKDLVSDTKKIRDKVVTAMNDMQSQLETVIENVKGEHNRMTTGMFEALKKQIDNQASQTEELVNKKIEAIEQSLQKELNQAFHLMGNHLAKITDRFTHDYKKLTEQMQNVVNRAEEFE